jgi:hypothetical protein
MGLTLLSTFPIPCLLGPRNVFGFRPARINSSLATVSLCTCPRAGELVLRAGIQLFPRYNQLHLSGLMAKPSAPSSCDCWLHLLIRARSTA